MIGPSFNLWEALAYGLPWWLLGGLVMAGLALVALRFGWRAALLAGTAGLLLIVDRRAAQRGWRDRQRKEDADEARNLETARLARLDAERAARDPGRLRADDGWRRDGGVLPGGPPHQLVAGGHRHDHPGGEGP